MSNVITARTCAFATAVAVMFMGSVPAQADMDRYEAKLKAAESVFMDATTRPGKGIPTRLVRAAKAIAIFPGTVRGGFIFGARYGEGVVLSQDAAGKWSAPAFFTIAGGNFGLQAGIQTTDHVLLIMNDKGLGALLKQRFTIGGDISVTAGPASISGEGDIDILLQADIISYAKSQGLFAGIAVNGARLAASPRMNNDFYGRRVTVDEIIVQRSIPVPAPARGLTATLEAYAAGRM